MTKLKRYKEPVHSIRSFFDWDPFDFWYWEFKVVDPSPSVSFESGKGENIFKFETPGFKKEDLEVSLIDNIITVEGKMEKKDKSYSFSKSYWLNESISSEDIKVDYKDGILTIKVPKLDKPDNRVKIEIK